MTTDHPQQALYGFGGVVSAGGPLAASTGLSVLRDGGNAVDAVIAAALVQSVVELPWGGIGGDAFVLVRAPSTEVLALNGSGASPIKLGAHVGDGAVIPRFGPLSVAVPGFVGAIVALHDRCGSLRLGELARPAIGYADDGFAVTPALSEAIDRVMPELGSDDPLRGLLESNGAAVGTRFRQPHLADTLRLVTERGAATFYATVGESICRSLRARGGALTPDDLTSHESPWSAPVSADYRGVEVYTHAPVSLGCLLLQQLKLYERLGAPYRPPADPARIDAMVRCKHVAFSDALPRLLRNDDAGRAAVDEVLDDDRIDQLAEQLSEAPVATLSSPIEAPEGSDTTCVVAADGTGWIAAIIHSLFNEFGSRELDPSSGVLLNDRLASQRHSTNGSGGLASGGRPLHTLNAVLATERGDAVVWATPGGRGQVQTSFQVVVNAFDGGIDHQQAIDEPRWLSGAPRRPEPDDQLYLEPGIPRESAAELELRGHRVAITDGSSSDLYGSCVLVGRSSDGALFGAADHRRQARAAVF